MITQHLQQLPIVSIKVPLAVGENQDYTRIPFQVQAAMHRTLVRKGENTFAKICSPHDSMMLPEFWCRQPLEASKIELVAVGRFCNFINGNKDIVIEAVNAIEGVSVTDNISLKDETFSSSNTSSQNNFNIQTLSPLSLVNKSKPLLRPFVVPRVFVRTAAERFRRLYFQYNENAAKDLPPLLGEIINSASESKITSFAAEAVGYSVTATKGIRFCRGLSGYWTIENLNQECADILSAGSSFHIGQHVSHGFGYYTLNA